MINRLLVADTVARIKEFAVAIQWYPDHTHAGVIYKSPTDGRHHVLHLGEPGPATEEPWNPSWGWAAIHAADVVIEHLQQLAVLCEHVADLSEQGEEIPYGFKYSYDTKFTTTGQLIVGTGMKGVTCGTFVLALLATYDIHLLAIDASWPVRPEDAQKAKALARYWNDPEISAEFPFQRFRPEEVIAACLVDSIPATFAVVEPLSLAVMDKMGGFADRRRSGV
jgi:hypothetical protein